MLAFRIQSSLLYFNADHVFETVRRKTMEQSDVRCVIGDLSNVPYVDVAGRMLRRLFEDLNSRNVAFRLVEAHGPVRDMLRLEDPEGVSDRYLAMIPCPICSTRDSASSDVGPIRSTGLLI